jgi:hypothetical protein
MVSAAETLDRVQQHITIHRRSGCRWCPADRLRVLLRRLSHSDLHAGSRPLGDRGILRSAGVAYDRGTTSTPTSRHTSSATMATFEGPRATAEQPLWPKPISLR